MEYRRNTPLAKQMHSPMRQDQLGRLPAQQPTELGYNDFMPEDIVNAYIAHYRNWRSIDEAQAYDKANEDNQLTNTNWNLGHKNGSYPEMEQLWMKATEARTRLGSYVPSLEDFNRALEEMKNPTL
tara:strand:- start:504 stop:881 length:378 start_codon:yes stop_codon:yes gene_type:complete